ncbi:J domain-containing protein [Paraburkholderia diazotrophica]|uniref:DnaJ domain-containing protein n=1 Tax=Paraburkholderia diazotrophica TaxID=667676 RepID=A0A1H6WH50_9BURK|nr:J domain-containing protein [Paraburkholderia diazotrophica]SEJ16223.1 DnaJ domain-containing protein [Paraburkholderia diazotrophica]
MKIHSHYDNLKVSRDAPQEVIRAAYRTLCQKYHPDRRIDDPDAERVMKIINASYAVLSDPVQRKEHDEWLARKEREASAAAATAAPSSRPAGSSHSSASSASSTYSASGFQQTPRYAAAQADASARSTPRGSGWTSQARVDPRAAGRKKQRVSFGHALRRVSLRGWIAIAACAFVGYVVITESMSPWPFTRNITSGASYGEHGHADADSAAATDSNGRALAAVASAQAATSPWTNDASGAASDAGAAAAYVRPSVAPNGAPWPATAGYLDGIPVGASGGHSSVTIDNSINRFDVYGKLVYNASVFDQPVRHFFVPAGRTFTLKDVAPGSYDIRYQNLDDGGIYKSQPFGLTEQTVGNGLDATHISVMLYASPGSMQATAIGRGEF